MARGHRKKHVQSYSHNSNGAYVHPSLSNSGGGNGEARSVDRQSVNGRLEHLRRAQNLKSSVRRSEELDARTRTRFATTVRRAAGPPAPRSWTIRSNDRHDDLRSAKWQGRRGQLDPFDKQQMPDERSLLHLVLKDMATSFDDVVQYDHVYLSELPVELRMLLMSYVAGYGSSDGVSYEGACALFAPELMSRVHDCVFDPVVSESVKMLDLGSAIGRRISVKQLERLWKRKPLDEVHHSVSQSMRDLQISTDIRFTHNDLPEAWNEVEDHDLGNIPVLASPIRFPHLTHLSLSYPGPSVSWVDLISFARHHLDALTHLSLAHWPPPSYGEAHTTPSSTPISSNSVPSRGGAHPAAPAYDVLTSLSRTTPALTWLSLADCQAWLGDLLQEMLQFSRQGKLNRSSHYPLSSQRALVKDNMSYNARNLRQDSFADFSVGLTNRHEASWPAFWNKLQHLDLGQSDIDIPYFQAEVSKLNNPIDRQNCLRVFETPYPASNREYLKRLLASDPDEAYTIFAGAVDVENRVKARRAAHTYHERDWICASVLGFYMLERAKHGWKKGTVNNSTPGAVTWELAII